MTSSIQNASVTVGSLKCKGPKPCPRNYFPSPTCENQVRLGGSSSSASGYIEISHKGQWRSICKDDFDKEDGDVICRMAGYPKGAKKVYEDFTRGGNNFWKSEFNCKGDENDILECQFKDFEHGSCSYEHRRNNYNYNYDLQYKRAAVECKP